MSPTGQPAPGKTLGHGMLIASFTFGLIALTFYFNGMLDDQSNPNSRPLTTESDRGIREVVLERNRQGHYVASGEINGTAVVFLLDTGATDVAIPEPVARKVGLQPGFASQAATANGVVTVYSTLVDELTIGNILLQDIEASITPSMAGETILLGMSALKQVEFTQRGSSLTLRQLPDSQY